MIEPLTGLEVAGIMQHCETKRKALYDQREEQGKTFQAQFPTEEDKRSPSAMTRLTNYYQDIGFCEGIEYVLEIIETRELP